jgi:hypothetical protein
MSQKHETPNLLETFTWEEFKLWLDERFMPRHLVLWNGIKLLEPTQGDDKGSLVAYIKDFSCMLNVVPLKNNMLESWSSYMDSSLKCER